MPVTRQSKKRTYKQAHNSSISSSSSSLNTERDSNSPTDFIAEIHSIATFIAELHRFIYKLVAVIRQQADEISVQEDFINTKKMQGLLRYLEAPQFLALNHDDVGFSLVKTEDEDGFPLDDISVGINNRDLDFNIEAGLRSSYRAEAEDKLQVVELKIQDIDIAMTQISIMLSDLANQPQQSSSHSDNAWQQQESAIKEYRKTLAFQRNRIKELEKEAQEFELLKRDPESVHSKELKDTKKLLAQTRRELKKRDADIAEIKSVCRGKDRKITSLQQDYEKKEEELKAAKVEACDATTKRLENQKSCAERLERMFQQNAREFEKLKEMIGNKDVSAVTKEALAQAVTTAERQNKLQECIARQGNVIQQMRAKIFQLQGARDAGPAILPAYNTATSTQSSAAAASANTASEIPNGTKTRLMA